MTQVRCYTRVSTDEQALSGYSLSAQREQLERFIARQEGWHCAGWYTDEGVSAKDTNRPEFRRLMLEALPGDVVLVYKLDRLTRSVRDLDDLLRTFEQRSMLFKSAIEQFETTTASGRLFIRIVAELAQWERELIAERTAMGKRQKVQLGEWPGGPIPFGYTSRLSNQMKGGKHLLELIADPPHAHLVKAIFERYRDGYGMRSICIWLNDEQGTRTANGARWRVSSLVRLLTNPIYCGDVTHGRRLKGAVIRMPGKHEPLVHRTIFDQVQEAFSRRKQMAPRQATGGYPLAGIARCGTCGGRIDGIRRRSGSYAYRCANYVNGLGCGNAGGRPVASIAGPETEAALIRAIDSLPRPIHLRDFFASCAVEIPEAEQAQLHVRERLTADRCDAERALLRWSRGYESGGITWEEYLQHAAPHRERSQAIQQQLQRLEETPPPRSRQIQPDFSFRAAWEGLSAPERKALLQRLRGSFGLEIFLLPDRQVALRPAPTPDSAPYR